MSNKFNPVLRNDLTLNDCPAVDLDQLKAIFQNQNFDVKMEKANEEAHFTVLGKADTDAENIVIKGTVFHDEDSIVLGGFSTSINTVGWDQYHIVKGESLEISGEIDDEAYEETETLLTALGIFEKANNLI